MKQTQKSEVGSFAGVPNVSCTPYQLTVSCTPYQLINSISYWAYWSGLEADPSSLSLAVSLFQVSRYWWSYTTNYSHTKADHSLTVPHASMVSVPSQFPERNSNFFVTWYQLSVKRTSLLYADLCKWRVIIANIYIAGYCSKLVTYFIETSRKSQRWILLSSLFYRWGDWNHRKMNWLPKITQVVRMSTQAVWLQSPLLTTTLHDLTF